MLVKLERAEEERAEDAAALRQSPSELQGEAAATTAPLNPVAVRSYACSEGVQASEQPTRTEEVLNPLSSYLAKGYGWESVSWFFRVSPTTTSEEPTRGRDGAMGDVQCHPCTSSVIYNLQCHTWGGVCGGHERGS
jgi:hypothetical protein